MRHMESAASALPVQVAQINFAAQKVGILYEKKVARVVLSMVMSFAVATFFMAGTVEAKAQEGRQGVAETCRRLKMTYHDRTSCEEANSEYHFVYQDRIGQCSDCPYSVLVSRKQVGYETHDSRGVAQAPLRWYCILCGYAE